MRQPAAMLAIGLVLGLLGSALAPACIFLDHCTIVQTYGNLWCANVEDARMWPIGSPELAEHVVGDNFSLPAGCQCLNDGEAIIIAQGAPADQAALLTKEIEYAARLECAWEVPPGYDHNCFEEDDLLGPNFSVPYFDEKSDDCVGSCSYINEPPEGCGADPNPWECNGESLEETSGTDTSDTETGSGLTSNGDIDRISP